VSNDLVQFLRARFDEEAARQQDIWEQWHHKDCEAVPQVLYPDRETGTCDCGVPTRVLADIEAKRRIVDLAAGMLAAAKGDSEVDHYGGLSAAEETLLLLAHPFRDHSDFNPAWLEN
jgi:hypothetical protein